MTAFSESVVEDAAPAWLESTGWQVAHRPDIAPDKPAAERRDEPEVVPGEWPTSRLAISRSRILRSADADFGVQPT